MSSANKALFLDRDGTLIEHIPYLHDPREVRLLPGVREALVRAMDAEFRLFLFTNQSGVARGLFTMAEVDACNRRMLELLTLPEPGFTAICVAPEAPGEEIRYRKPSPRFIHEMIEAHALDPRQCWMIGDSECDLQAAANAGITGVMVDERRTLAEVVTKLAEPGKPA